MTERAGAVLRLQIDIGCVTSPLGSQVRTETNGREIQVAGDRRGPSPFPVAPICPPGAPENDSEFCGFEIEIFIKGVLKCRPRDLEEPGRTDRNVDSVKSS